ncbi:Sel1 domain protein repeat-containing protein [Escherichia coli]|uniref:Sel1 domain protein repeat-containing protein n=1 Tax=Escherichia coli TaxID=562 RepID=A0A376UFZ7_ECOLX|nr:Sel1 domain protein repeat-containing protein [Escherichia coli]
MYWYLKAAAQESVGAYVNIGYMYKHGQGVEKDYQAAFEWFTKAAECNDATAWYNLAIMYHYGEGDLSISDRLSTCIVKFSHPEPEMSVRKFVRLKIYCRDKNKGRGISFGPYSLYCCANQTITAQTGVSGTGHDHISGIASALPVCRSGDGSDISRRPDFPARPLLRCDKPHDD